VLGASGDGLDIFVCAAASTGETTDCTFSAYFDAAASGFIDSSLDGISVTKAIPVRAASGSTVTTAKAAGPATWQPAASPTSTISYLGDAGPAGAPGTRQEGAVAPRDLLLTTDTADVSELPDRASDLVDSGADRDGRIALADAVLTTMPSLLEGINSGQILVASSPDPKLAEIDRDELQIELIDRSLLRLLADDWLHARSTE
jgi:hypothetical protein